MDETLRKRPGFRSCEINNDVDQRESWKTQNGSSFTTGTNVLKPYSDERVT